MRSFLCTIGSLSLLLASCGTTTSPATDAGSTSEDVNLGPGFGNLYTGLKMQAGCAVSGCHDKSGAKVSGNLDLSSEDTAFAALTSGTKDGGCAIPRVTPGDHAKSSLWIRLNTTTSKLVTCGGTKASPMPSGGPYYSAGQIAAVAAWIDAGATK